MRADTKKKTDSKGMTLVEMVVTFAVAAIFMAAAAALIVPATKMTLYIKGMNRVHDDAAIIMETIVNELNYAEGYYNAEESGPAVASETIRLKEKYASGAGDPYDDYYQQIEYNSKNGNPAIMRVGGDGDGDEKKGKLLITYPAIKVVTGQNADDTPVYETLHEEMVWEYGQGLYQGNEIQLGFKKKTDENIITVRLTVTNPASGYTYTEETDIRCINVEADKIVAVDP